jgi:hypothetical protein
MRAGRTGLNLLVRRQILASLITGFGCGIGSQLHLFVIGRQPAERPSLIEFGWTLFVSPNPIFASAVFVGTLVLTGFWTAFAPDWLRVRHLRVLPMATPTLAAMFILLPALFWLTLWVSLPASYWFLAGLRIVASSKIK